MRREERGGEMRREEERGGERRRDSPTVKPENHLIMSVELQHTNTTH